MAHYSWTDATRKPGFWFVAALLLFVTLPHYYEALEYPAFITRMIADLSLPRDSFERILFLAPIIWAGFPFGWRGTVATSLAALALMLPRAALISPTPSDAMLEAGAVFVVGNVLNITLESLRKERQHRAEMEKTQRELRASEERYRQLFESAHDAILITGLEGAIVGANKGAVGLTGYDLAGLCCLKIGDLLSEEGKRTVEAVHKRLLDGENGSRAEVTLTRKDGTEATVQLGVNMVRSDGRALAFQYVARDVTEQKRMQENIQYYLQQATRAQEEERKRIARDLHDETVQDLVAISRQLDILASRGKELSPENTLLLKELRQQTSHTMQQVRRFSQDLRPVALDRLGLLPALEWLVSDVTKYSGIATRVNMIGSEGRLPEETESALFRIAQEALRNVWRHSQATKAEITIEFEPNMVRMSIADNGKGFEVPKTISELPRDGKLGLAGMQERARLLGGALTVHSEPGEGCNIKVEIPARLPHA
ncbi:MAG: PAS domain S-box protein [Chloroflexi bacterium]|nr:PAS domain S-box protein [Chloroflexota bacterium]